MTKKKSKIEKRIKVKSDKKIIKRRIDLTPLTKTMLWSMVLGTDTVAGLSETLNMDKDRVENEINGLLQQDMIIERGRFVKSYDLTAHGYEMMGSPAIKLESYLSSPAIKSGGFTKLTVVAKNTGNIPITDAFIKIISPIFLRIARHGATYYKDYENSIVNLNLTHLNPGETQTLEFNLHGNLTSSTLSSKYKVLVNAAIGNMITDKKELGILVEA